MRPAVITHRHLTRLTRRRFLALCPLAALPCALPRTAYAASDPFADITTVEVFCNSAMLIEPVANAPFKQDIYRLDALEQLRQSLSQRMPQDLQGGGEEAAYRWLMQNQARIKRELAPAAAAAANALNLANYYRIDRLPAIVINRRSVVYGITSVSQAIAYYQAHQQERQERMPRPGQEPRP